MNFWVVSVLIIINKVVLNSHVYLTYMQSTSYEMPGWMKHKQEPRFQGEY